MVTDTFELEQELRAYLIGKKLLGLSIYQVNTGNIIFERDKKWLIDGGVELDFGAEMFSFGWDLDLELFKSCNQSIHSLTRDIELTRYDERSFSPLRNLLRLEITDIALKWNFYCDLDEDFLPID